MRIVTNHEMIIGCVTVEFVVYHDGNSMCSFTRLVNLFVDDLNFWKLEYVVHCFIQIRSLHLQLEHFSQPPSVKVLINHLQKKYPGGEYYSAYEAGFSGTGIHEQFCSAGVHNIVVHPADIPSTDKQNKNKSDVRDSRSIAFHLEKGNLHGICIMSRDKQELRSLFRFRQTKVRDMIRTKNRLKSFLLYFGVRLSEVFEGKEYLTARALKWLRNLKLGSEAGTITLNKFMDDLIYQRSQLLKKNFGIEKTDTNQVSSNLSMSA